MSSINRWFYVLTLFLNRQNAGRPEIPCWHRVLATEEKILIQQKIHTSAQRHSKSIPITSLARGYTYIFSYSIVFIIHRSFTLNTQKDNFRWQ